MVKFPLLITVGDKIPGLNTKTPKFAGDKTRGVRISKFKHIYKFYKKLKLLRGVNTETKKVDGFKTRSSIIFGDRTSPSIVRGESTNALNARGDKTFV